MGKTKATAAASRKKNREEPEMMPQNKDIKQVTATDVTLTFEWIFHDPTKTIYGWNDLLKALPELFGPNYVGTVYNNRCRNIRTADLAEEAHHCSTCKHARALRCITLGHNFFCLEWVTVNGFRVRCCQQFQINSPGCGLHLTHDSHNNTLVKQLAERRITEIPWEAFNDQARNEEYYAAQAEARKTNQSLVEELNECCEKYDAAGVLIEVDANQYSVFEDKKKAERIKTRTKLAEERELRAAIEEELRKLSATAQANLRADPQLLARWERDTGARLKEKQAKELEAVAMPKNPRRDELEAKRLGATGKRKGQKQKRNWAKKGKAASQNEENEPTA